MSNKRNKVYSLEGRSDKETSIFCGVQPIRSGKRQGTLGRDGSHANLGPGCQVRLSGRRKIEYKLNRGTFEAEKTAYIKA